MNTPEWLQNAAEVASLAVTVPAIVLGIGVVVHWAPAAYRNICSRKEMNAHDWFILGVTIGFIGGVADNLWWGVAWSCDYIHSDYRDWWFRHGVYSNIIFRQLCGTYAAWCHMVAFYQTGRSMKAKAKSSFVLTISLAIGLVYTFILTLFKR